MKSTADASVSTGSGPDPSAPSDVMLIRLRSGPDGLSSDEAGRRLLQFGRNELTQRRENPLWKSVVAQLTHPLALLLFAASALSFATSSQTLAWTIIGVIVLNAAFALQQERQAERAVEALRALVPHQATVLRDATPMSIDVELLVPGDVLVVSEGQRISGDARVLEGEVTVDMSTLSGESAPVVRTSEPSGPQTALVECPDLIFSGTSCTSGTCHALVYATGDHTELGRIAALAQQGRREDSPLERQVKRVARLIAIVAVAVGIAFLPIGLLAGLSLKDSALFAIGLLVANVPEGLLPTITLALAAGVRVLARRGAVVKRLSAVETLGSTTVICTDKTGTITQNKMRPVAAWVVDRDVSVEEVADDDAVTLTLARAVAACATSGPADAVAASVDPTEAALADAARTLLGGRVSPDLVRLHSYPFQAAIRLSSTVDRVGGSVFVHVKGAPEAVLANSRRWLSDHGPVELSRADRDTVAAALDRLAQRGLRVIGVGQRALDSLPWPDDRTEAECDLTFLGLIALLDPPRPEVASAVETCHRAGIRINVITGDNPLTAAEIARQVGIGDGMRRVVTGRESDAMPDSQLAATFARPYEVICARSSPENKMRIAGVLRDQDEVVAMTGDGVNDAPALRHADIGVAMGRSGTDVAREAATVVLTDDDFSSIVTAVEEGRRVYDNVRKFIVYIFAHAVPEVVPFLVFALSGGAVPLPLTVILILCIDLGTETLPALALGREPAERGLMQRPPRPAHESLVTKQMLIRAWGLLGVTSAALTMIAFFYTLLRGGWSPSDPVGVHSTLHHAYLQATTATFAAIVACQVGTALASRTEHASLRSVGVATNRLLLAGIAFELAFTAGVVYLPALNDVLSTAPLPLDVLLVIAPMPVVVWGVDELYRAARRRRDTAANGTKGP
ncbi:MAG TPA: cation-transporting P-type ATPase [Nocardioidaceae bacterium]|nr:cation-transporting P-type ATPase [Nocardioidaceae bacterium]